VRPTGPRRSKGPIGSPEYRAPVAVAGSTQIPAETAHWSTKVAGNFAGGSHVIRSGPRGDSYGSATLVDQAQPFLACSLVARVAPEMLNGGVNVGSRRRRV